MEHRRTGPRRTPLGDDAGVTLIEVVIASVLLATMAAAVLGIILQTQSVQVGNRARVAAANLAARELDIVREEFLRSRTAPLEIADQGAVTNPHPLDGGTTGQPLVVDGVPYTVVRSAGWNITGTGASACEGGSLVAYPTLGVTVTVTWPNMGTIAPVVAHAKLAPDKGTGVPTTASFVAVEVLTADGLPNPGRTVKVANGAYVKTGLTDSSGCAVVQVDPSESGTDYTVSLGDSGYVDITGNQTPSKQTGPVQRGRLSTSVAFAYDRAGSVEIRLVDPSGGSLSDAEVAGFQVTLVASEYSGTSGATTYVLGGVSHVITGLWPTEYGGYSGTTPPAGGYPFYALPPGGTVVLEVPFEMASTTITGVPAGASQVIAVPSAAGTTCTTPGARVVNPSNVRLLPGAWDLFAVGTVFGCSPGPVGEVLNPGINDPVEWGETTLRVTDAPAGTLWALERSQVGTTLTTCPGSQGGNALNIDGARTGPLSIPAGAYYLYVTDGPATGTCSGFLAGGARGVPYGGLTEVLWPAPAPQQVTVTNVPVTYQRFWVTTYATIVASRNSTITCTRTAAPADITQFALNSNQARATAELASGIWYIFGWNKAEDINASWGSSSRCRLAGIVNVGSRPLELAYNHTNPGTVGP